jgi:hypothetical protein
VFNRRIAFTKRRPTSRFEANRWNSWGKEHNRSNWKQTPAMLLLIGLATGSAPAVADQNYS